MPKKKINYTHWQLKELARQLELNIIKGQLCKKTIAAALALKLGEDLTKISAQRYLWKYFDRIEKGYPDPLVHGVLKKKSTPPEKPSPPN